MIDLSQWQQRYTNTIYRLNIIISVVTDLKKPVKRPVPATSNPLTDVGNYCSVAIRRLISYASLIGFTPIMQPIIYDPLYTRKELYQITFDHINGAIVDCQYLLNNTVIGYPQLSTSEGYRDVLDDMINIKRELIRATYIENISITLEL